MFTERLRQIFHPERMGVRRVEATASSLQVNQPATADVDGDWRYERKYFLDSISAEDTELMIRLCPHYFRQVHPDRYINNIYLDSATLRCYWENLDGVSPRFKQRIRWYGDLHQDNAAATLEIKRKYNAVGDKIRVPLGAFNTSNDITNDGVYSLLKSAGSDRPFRSHGDGFRCTLVNRYLRRYYATFDSLFRATIDRELQYYPLEGGQRKKGLIVREKATILEIKYAKDHESIAREILQSLPYRPARISKYVHGINMLRAHHYL